LQPATLTYKLIKKVKDDRFDEEKLHQYELLIQLGVKDFQVGIVDTENANLIFFEDYVLGDLQSHQDFFDLLKNLFDSHQLLQAGFWQAVKVSIKNNKFTQVPTSLFVPEACADYLKFNAHFDSEKEEIIYCSNTKVDAVTVFAVQKNLLSWLRDLYKNTKLTFHHQSTALIEGVVHYSLQEKDNPLYVYVDRFKLHILSVRQGKLIYYNQFIIKQFPDYIKYIMLVLKGLSMDQSSSRIILWGYIGKNSPHYLEFCKYVRNVVFGSRPDHIKFGYMFDEVQEHHFFDLYSINLLKG
jgi:hypothetical protein